MQYLHQLGVLHILPTLVKKNIVPPSVEEELNSGLRLGLSVPNLQRLDWVTVRRPSSSIALPLVTDLGPGEREVLALALETPDSVRILDDGLARQVAKAMQLRVTGTLGVLIDSKQSGIIPSVRPLLDQLQSLGFRLAAYTRAAVFDMAGEV